MNLRDLEYLLAVERSGGITRAAEACGVAQPTMSTQLAKLERTLGVALFERDGRTLRLTDAGRTAVLHAARIVAEVEDLLSAIKAHRDPFTGAVRLGFIPTLAPYLLPRFLAALRESLPLIVPAIFEEQTASLLAALRDGTLDAAVLATEHADERLASELLFDEPLWVALPKESALAQAPSITPADLDPATMLLLAEGHCLREQALAFCKEPLLGKNVRGDFRAASLETIINLVEAGLGVTLIPELCLHMRPNVGSRVVVRRFAAPGASRRIYLTYRRSTSQGALLAKLAQTLRGIWDEVSVQLLAL